mgnify:CR=1 FL=1
MQLHKGGITQGAATDITVGVLTFLVIGTCVYIVNKAPLMPKSGSMYERFLK